MATRKTTSGAAITLLPKLLDPNREAPNLVDAIARHAREMQAEAMDEPLVALALRYAAEIEDAAELTAEAERLLVQAADEGDYFARKEIARLRRRIELAETVAKVGPLLRQALVDLNAAPAARKGGRKTVGAGRLQQLQGEAGA